jgi:hypothetical protein
MLFIKAFGITLCVLGGALFSQAQRIACPAVGAEFMSVEGNSPIITLHFKRQNGTTRRARFAFDSGGGAVVLDSALASDLGLTASGTEIREG